MIRVGMNRHGPGPSCQTQGTMGRFVYADGLEDQLLPYATNNLNKKWVVKQITTPRTQKRIRFSGATIMSIVWCDRRSHRI